MCVVQRCHASALEALCVSVLEYEPSPGPAGVHFWPYRVFEAVRDTVRCSGIQQIQLDAHGYSGIQWIYFNMDRY